MIHLKKGEDIKIKSNFSILYTCLSIIILTFFVFLTVNSTISPERKKIAIGSLIGSFGLLKTSFSPLSTEHTKEFGTKLINIGKSKDITKAVKEIISKSYLESYVTVINKKEGLLIKTRGKIAFVKGSAKINKTYKVFLNRIYNFFSDAKNLKIKIIAYPDNFLTPEFISKWDLSIHRAFNIADFFIKRGIDINSISAYGNGVVQLDGTKLKLIISGRKFIYKNTLKNKIDVKGIEFKVD